MKTLFIETRKKNKEADITALLNSSLPKALFICYSIQYKDLAKDISSKLKARGFIIKGLKQVLGCTKLKTKYPILLVSDGKFHSLNLGLQNNSPIYIYSNLKLEELDKAEIDKIRKTRRTAYLNFLNEKEVGIIISTKPGQCKLKQAEKIKEQLEKKGKELFMFISNNINVSELENFPLKIWINTACPGLSYDSTRIINLNEIENL